MSDPHFTAVDDDERRVNAQLDSDLAMLTSQGQYFQQQFNIMAAAWQPMPPQMLAQYADGLARWVDYFRYAAEPAAQRLARAGRPAVGQRLAAVMDDLIKAVGTYRQMAGQQMTHFSALTQATVASNRETAAVWKATTAERSAAHDRVSAARRSVL